MCAGKLLSDWGAQPSFLTRHARAGSGQEEGRRLRARSKGRKKALGIR